MKRILSVCFINLFFCSCHEKTDNIKKNSTIVTINLKTKKLNKIYLVDAYEWDKFLDSASGQNNFEFKIGNDEKNKNPLFSIAYLDSTNSIKEFEFDNRILSPDSTKYLIDAFIPDKDTIRITDESPDNGYYFISAGNENSALYATQMMNFGYLDGDINTRTQKLNDYLSIIKKYPTSLYLLSKIDENKSVLKKNELEAMLGTFTKESLKSSIGKKLKDYTDKKGTVTVLENFKINDESDNQVEIINTSAKINMIILWASWCIPCRMEIPEIKKLYEKYHDKGLSIVSISTDNKRDDWRKALAMEQMKWKQLIVPDSLKKNFSEKFEISSIPDVIFTDSKGKVVQRMIGYEKNISSQYEVIIQKQLGED